MKDRDELLLENNELKKRLKEYEEAIAYFKDLITKLEDFYA